MDLSFKILKHLINKKRDLYFPNSTLFSKNLIETDKKTIIAVLSVVIVSE